MVAVASATPGAASASSRTRAWSLASLAALVVGLGLRLVLGDGGTGDRSAIVMMALLAICVWVAAGVLSSPRTAFLITLGLMALVDAAALPARNQPVYDDLDAFYQTDQVLSEQVGVPQGLAQPVLSVLVQPFFAGAQPTFGLAGDVNGTGLSWQCSYPHGIHWLALPVPSAALTGAGSAQVRLHLTGAPRRETDYLLVYASSVQGGFLVSLADAGSVAQDATRCSLQ